MKLEIVYLSPHELKPYENNTRKHAPEDIDQIKASIEADGFNDPIGIWGEDNLIVEGHGRQIAAIEMGLDKVPCIRLDHMKETQRRDYAIRHNRTAELSGWDFAKLEEEIAALEIEGVDLSGLKFDFENVERGGGNTEANIVEDEPPEPPETPVSKRGDVWQLGRHRLMCGDSTSFDDVQKLMNGAIADVCITSPPYGVANSAAIRKHYVKGAKTLKSFYDKHDDKKEEWFRLMEDFMGVARLFSNSQFINVEMLADNKHSLVDWINVFNTYLVDIIVWDKTKSIPQMNKNILNNEFEFVFIFGSEDNATRTIPFSDFHANKSNMLRIPSGNNEFSDIHKAVFPVRLPSELLSIANNAKTVYEPFCGTGTTLIACEEMGRQCFAMELSEAYVDVIIKRWENLTGEKAVLLSA